MITLAKTEKWLNEKKFDEDCRYVENRYPYILFKMTNTEMEMNFGSASLKISTSNRFSTLYRTIIKRKKRKVKCSMCAVCIAYILFMWLWLIGSFCEATTCWHHRKEKPNPCMNEAITKSITTISYCNNGTNVDCFGVWAKNKNQNEEKNKPFFVVLMFRSQFLYAYFV